MAGKKKPRTVGKLCGAGLLRGKHNNYNKIIAYLRRKSKGAAA